MTGYQGREVAQSFGWQRKMLDELTELKERGERPTILALSHTLGITEATARRCLQWLQHEGFVRLARVSAVRTGIELLASPGDDELRTAIAGRRAAP